MAPPGIVFLMYHELELPGRGLAQSGPGYVRYIVSHSSFQSQIAWLRDHGWRGLSVGEALRSRPEKSVAITFDDGCETDWIAAAPILREAAFRATFYITAGFLDQPGYMGGAQLRQLRSAGFEIGCHSMTHPYLNDLAPRELHHEIVDSLSRLEDVLGSRVEHFSCPGGRYDARALALAKQAGYKSLATSRVHANLPSTDPFQLGRVAIMRNLKLSAFEGICTGENLWKIRFCDSLRLSARRIIGNVIYDRFRAAVLRQS